MSKQCRLPPGGQPHRPLRLVALLAPLVAGACAETSLSSSAAKAPGLEPPAMTEARPATPEIDHASVARPRGAVATAIAEARALRRAGDKQKALARLEGAAEDNPADKSLLKERGMIALELGQVAKAETLLSKAIDPQAPDWRLYSALGAALSAAGKQQQAQVQLAKALELAPDHPAVLNNLALSYALDGKRDEAEKLLRRVSQAAPKSPQASQARQNLALLLGLGGRLEEAQQVSEGALPADKAKANITYLQSLAGEPGVSRADVKATATAEARTPAYQLGAARP